MSAELSRERPLAKQPRLLEFPLKQELRDVIGSPESQVINLIGGGNVPETPDALARAIAPSENQQNGLTPEQEYLKALLPTLDDVPWHMYDRIVAYNNVHDQKLRFIDTPARIQEQYVALKDTIEEMIGEQIKKGTKNIVFTVCGASPPDLQIIRAIQALNEEYQGQEGAPQLYAAIFLPGDEQEVIRYSVQSGLHSEFWEALYAKAKADNHIFIHEPQAAEGFAGRLEDESGDVQFKKVRAVSMEEYEHNRAGNVDVNRRISEVAGRPPILGVFAESLTTPKQFLGSGRELIARQLWLLRQQMTPEEAFESIKIIQHGFIFAVPWTPELAEEIYQITKEQYDAESEAGVWPHIQ